MTAETGWAAAHDGLRAVVSSWREVDARWWGADARRRWVVALEQRGVWALSDSERCQQLLHWQIALVLTKGA
jgi:hypothetical protein